MTETNGLQNIMANAGTLHSIEGPPCRSEFLTDAEFYKAYDAWWARAHLWKADAKGKP